MCSSKKCRERFYLNKFLALLGITPDDVKEGESPDFIVSFKDRKVGIEVTEYHSSSKGEKDRPRRAIEEDWRCLQKEIMAELKKNNELENTLGLIYFKKLELPNRLEHKKFIVELVQFAIEIVKAGIMEKNPGETYPLLSKYIRKLYVQKVGIYVTWEWNYNVASVGLTEDEFIAAIKSKLISNYSDSQFDELLLLIVSGHRLSQAMGIHLLYNLNNYKKLEDDLRKSFFNRVFIYQYMFDFIYEWPGWIQRVGKDSG